MSSPETVLQNNDTAIGADLYLSFELGDKRWKLTMSDGRRGPSRYTVCAGDRAAVLDCIRKAKARCGLDADAKARSCYEAGRDGWWLHRWLLEQGIDSIVVDSSSIEVNRRAKRAKTDRLDGDKLLGLLRRYHGGERRVWSVLHEPTPQQEDARRTHREIARLTKERDAHTNRIGSLLVLHNLRPGRIGGRDWARWWSNHGEQVPPNLCAEIERESARLALVNEQMKTMEAARRQAIATGRHPVVAQLAKFRAGPGSWIRNCSVGGALPTGARSPAAWDLRPPPTTAATAESIKASVKPATSERARCSWSWRGSGSACSRTAP